MLTRFAKDKKGYAMATFAIAAIPMMALTGLAVDVSMAWRNQINMQAAFEATSLLLARRSVLNPNITEAELVEQGKAMIATRLRVPVTYTRFVVDTNKVEVRIEGLYEHNTTFSMIVNEGPWVVKAQAVAEFERRDIEIAVAVDITRSMNAGTGDMTRMEAARQAVTALADVLSAGSIMNAQNASLKLALVPFDGQVRFFDQDKADDIFNNPNRYQWVDWTGESDIHFDHLPQYTNWLGQTGQQLNRRQVFANLRAANPDYAWAGCFEMRRPSYAFENAKPASTRPDSLFVPFLAPDERDRQSGGNPNSAGAENSYLPDFGPACMSAAHPDYTDANEAAINNTCKYDASNGALSAAPTWRTWNSSSPNGFCTGNPPVLDLTSDVEKFKEQVALLDTSASWGVTDTVVGIAAAWAVLDIAEPFTEAAKAGNAKKFMIVLSDGLNAMRNSTANNNYSSFGYPLDGRLAEAASMDDVGSNPSSALSQAQVRLCEGLLADPNEIEVYYVFFGNASSSAAAVGRSCVSAPENFIQAQNSQELIDVFTAIANNIGKLRLKPAS